MVKSKKMRIKSSKLCDLSFTLDRSCTVSSINKSKNNYTMYKVLVENYLADDYIFDIIKLVVIDKSANNTQIEQKVDKLIPTGTGFEYCGIINITSRNCIIHGTCIMKNTKNNKIKSYKMPYFKVGEINKLYH